MTSTEVLMDSTWGIIHWLRIGVTYITVSMHVLLVFCDTLYSIYKYWFYSEHQKADLLTFNPMLNAEGALCNPRASRHQHDHLGSMW